MMLSFEESARRMDELAGDEARSAEDRWLFGQAARYFRCAQADNWMRAAAPMGTLRECLHNLPMELLPRDTAACAEVVRGLVLIYQQVRG